MIVTFSASSLCQWVVMGCLDKLFVVFQSWKKMMVDKQVTRLNPVLQVRSQSRKTQKRTCSAPFRIPSFFKDDGTKIAMPFFLLRHPKTLTLHPSIPLFLPSKLWRSKKGQCGSWWCFQTSRGWHLMLSSCESPTRQATRKCWKQIVLSLWALHSRNTLKLRA